MPATPDPYTATRDVGLRRRSRAQRSAGGVTSATPFGFAGDYTNPSGLIYLVDRYYDPGTGRHYAKWCTRFRHHQLHHQFQRIKGTSRRASTGQRQITHSHLSEGSPPELAADSFYPISEHGSRQVLFLSEHRAE